MPPTDEPIFDDYDERDLPAGVRAELKSVPPGSAHVIGGHLLMAGQLLDDDPATALAHALAAKRRGGRLQVVREAVAEAAYAAEDYKVAFSEYQAIRRMTGDDNYLPVMADCQRALGLPSAGLELLAEVDPARLGAEQRVEAVLVAAGARLDLEQADEAQRLLRSAIAGRRGGRAGQARLRYAYAAVLESLGDKDGARQWFESAASLDPTVGRDAQNRVDLLDGLTVDDDDDATLGVTVDEELGAAWDDSDDDDSDDDSDDDDSDDDDHASWGDEADEAESATLVGRPPESEVEPEAGDDQPVADDE